MKYALILVAIFSIAGCHREQRRPYTANIKPMPLSQTGIVHYDTTYAFGGVTQLYIDDQATTYISANGSILRQIPIGLVYPLPDGNLIGRSDTSLIKFNADMDIIWRKPIPLGIHHEITADDSGRIYLLTNRVHLFMGKRVRFDALNIYSPDGELVYQWDVFEHLKDFVAIISKSKWCDGLPLPYDSAKGVESFISQDLERFLIPIGAPNDTAICSFEFSHLNSIQVLTENQVSATIPAFKKGNLLISFNPYASYGILNPNSGKIEWAAYLPERTTLHTPRFTPSGTILVFQNSTETNLWQQYAGNAEWINYLPKVSNKQTPVTQQQTRHWVSATEYNPITNNIVWQYTAAPKQSMIAEFSGSTQRLPNGNTLICVATPTGGRQFEVTPQKQIVWEYVSPQPDPERGVPWCYYRAKRLDDNTARIMLPEYVQ